MRRVSRLYLSCLVLSLAACSPVQPQVQSEQYAPETTPATDAPALPEVDVTPALMYDLLVAELAGQQGNLKLAATKYLTVASATRDPRAAKRATHIAIYNRDFESALQAARLWVETAPRDAEALQSVAALHIRRGQLDEALTYLKRLLEQTGAESGLLVAANLLSRENDRQKALDVMRRLVADYGDTPPALFAYAHLSHAVGEHDAALEALDKLLARQAGDRRALTLRATVLQQAGRREEAITTLREALEAHPQDLQLHLSLARLLIETRRLDEAREQFRAAAALQPDNADVHYALGLLALEADELDEAKDKFQRVLQLGERRQEALFALGQIAELKKDFNEAIEMYESIDASDNYLRARVRVAGILNRRDGADKALGYLDGVALADPADRLHIFLAKAELLIDAGRLEEAMAVYDRGLEAFGGHADLLYGRAMLGERMGRLDVLERDLKRILETDADNAQALNALGYTLADRTQRYDEAMGYIQRALAQEPDDPAILDSMGWVLYRLGRYDEALGYLRRALDRQEDGEIAAHLGEVLWVSGQQQEARRVWEAATRYAPDHKVLRRTMERFLP